MKLFPTLTLLIICGFFTAASQVFAQNSVAEEQSPNEDSLTEIQSSLEGKLVERDELRSAIKTSEKDALPGLKAKLQLIIGEIESLQGTFEQMAIGSVELDVFEKIPANFNWHDELTQIFKPVMESLKELTEKPRKIGQFRSTISHKLDQKEAAQKAILAIEQKIQSTMDESTRAALSDLLQSWTDKSYEASKDIDFARIQLNSLQNSSELSWISVASTLKGIALGRSLTLVIAVAASTVVWYCLRWLLKVLDKRFKAGNKNAFRTQQRIVHYAFKLLNSILTIVVLVMVFYIRGDMLLLALAALIITVLIVGLRNTFPKFLSETRLLLNIGTIREDERVMYNGLPWQVVSINIFSELRNPELAGVLRIPIESMVNLVSRPADNEIWFPTSKGEFILMPGGKLLRVVSQTPERVELESLLGTKTTYPSSDFNSMTFDNLSRGKNYAVVGVFRIGYEYQAISREAIPQKLLTAMQNALSETDLADSVDSVAVELKEAAPSSLDFWICITMDSKAASAHARLTRLIQQVCVNTCTEEDWEIPFPQLTLHRA